jgi:uncharacterized protein (TIRG00374 family)
MKESNMNFIFLSVVFMIMSHLSRAYRWKYLLEPLGYKSSFINRMLSVFICYISNLGIPRSGEIIRATSLSSYENLSFEKTFGSIVAERIVDLFILLSFLIISLILQFDLISSILFNKKIDFQNLIYIILIIIFLIFLFIKIASKNNYKFVLKLKFLLEGFIEGVFSLKSMPKKIPFVLHTIFIWLMYLSTFYIIKWSIDETTQLNIIEILPAFVIGSLSITTTNGGIGIFPLSVAITLTAYGVSKEAGLAFGWIVWSAQTIVTIVLGGLSFFILPLVNRKNTNN